MKKHTLFHPFVFFIFLTAVFYSACTRPTLKEETITLDANNGISNQSYQYDAGPVIQHEGFSGSKCVELNDENQFGLSVVVENARPGEHFSAEVRRLDQKSGAAFLVAECSWGPYLKQGIAIDSMREKNWDLLRLSLVVPKYLQNAVIKFYVWNPNKVPVLFDDLSIHRSLPDSLLKSGNILFRLDSLSIEIDSAGMYKLEHIRQKAIQKGILESSDADWVSGKLINGKEVIQAKFRLKGDWTDHLVGKKWSFRIKLDKSHYWNRIRTFSVQRPESRMFLHEWLYHKLLLSEDNLSPRYGFLMLQLNNHSPGLYAWEEFFEKQLLEYHHRREGPIVKFNEDGFWQSILKGLGNNTIDTLTPYYAASIIEPFKHKKTLGNPVLRNEFLQAQNLMNAYRNASLPVSEIFNLKQMAVFFAIVDLTQAYHSLRWHNLRFYYNPITARLEPIGYDGFGEEIMPWTDPFIGYRQTKYRLSNAHGEDLLTTSFFKDTVFYRMYIQDLYRFTNPIWLDAALSKLTPEIHYYGQIIQSEYPDYKSNLTALFKRAAALRKILLPLKTATVTAYRISKHANQQQLIIKNFHSVPVNIMAIGLSDKEPGQFISNQYLYPVDINTNTTWDTLSFSGEGNYLYYRIPGIDSLFWCQINDYPPPLPAKAGKTDFKSLENLFTIKEKQVIFNNALLQIKQAILIPPGYRVIIPAGTTLNFTNSASFTSYSPVIIEGSASKPVLIQSTDSSARGFSIIQAKETSVFSYAHFDHLNTFNEAGRILTGAVNIYESNIQITHCRFSRNQCEDAINIIRSDFNMSESSISHTLADGLDLDFSNGTISHCHFADIGNDAMDFSGSRVEVDSCYIKRAGDKGLSAGEASHVAVNALMIEHSLRGITAKDLSLVTIEKLNLVDCLYGFVAFQKKPEYGPAVIRVKSFKAKHIRYLEKIETGSQLIYPVP